MLPPLSLATTPARALVSSLLLGGCFSSHDGGGGASGGPDAAAAVDDVGAACVVSIMPAGGWEASEVAFETPARGCSGDICIVYHLAGDPSPSCTSRCADPEEVQRRIFCSCRCDGAPAGFGTCTCPAGFRCERLLSSLLPPEVRGSYCVSEELPRG